MAGGVVRGTLWAMGVKYIPDGVHTITPYLTVSDAAAVLDFILRGLDNVTTIHEMKGKDGTIWHADLKIGDSHLMLGQGRKPEDAMEFSGWEVPCPVRCIAVIF